ncbi:indolepyruvate ferredoxin oxidoreductase subunit alpha, partial [Patescibacteria group bacterium]|nr:indolepyruvate ferredoxin oxidoreductase subunit alpha [Patescibacteria group bacterium]
MNWENIFLKKQSGKEILLGNNAIIRAALEAGVQFVSTYPGTPTSEIGDGFSLLKKADKGSFYFEYSINEKVALEAGIGASFSNLKTLVAMKNFGL